MPFETNQKPTAEKTRKVLLVDGDNDRYRRKERAGLLQQEGFRVFPVLKIDHARARCKPGAFDLVAVIPGENAELAMEFCDEVRRNNPQQQILLVSGSNHTLPDRDYLVSSWEDLMKKTRPASNADASPTVSSQKSLTAA
ncbi:MAG: hypothetical protein DMG60_08350 [Acidobacteria bacterium]|nr:MAG: hypothetical protein DMG60_08350 [Acidobacteriota bacterium]